MGVSPVPLQRLGRALSALRRPSSPGLAVEQAVAALVLCLPDTMVGLSVGTPDTLTHQAASDERAAVADACQLDLGSGPLLDAARLAKSTGSVVIADDPRWPAWSERMAERPGLDAVTAVPLMVGEQVCGVFTVYSAEPLDDVERATLDVLATVAALTLDVAIHHQSLLDGLENRSIIGQAQGILMERFELDAAGAFAVLRRVSQHGNVKLRVVAGETVRTRRTPGSSGSDEHPG